MTRRACTGVLIALVIAVALGAEVARAADVSVQLGINSDFVLKDHNGSEFLRVQNSTGNISRQGALFVHTTGFSSVFVGRGAGPQTYAGLTYANTALGFYALRTNTTASGNSAFGAYALRTNTSGSLNTAIGLSALANNSSGYANSAFGSQALVNNTTGSANVAFGRDALASNSTASANTAVGYSALSSNTTGIENAAFGHHALLFNSTGYSNAAFGQGALRANTTAPQNSAFGWSALRDNTTGGGNSAVGSFALRNNTTGGSNVGFGQTALRANTVGSDNAALGRAALYHNTSGSRNVAVGSGAGTGQTTGNDNIYLASAGVAGESGRIRIGTAGTHTQTQVAGIHGATSGGGIGVLVNASGVLGTTTSSARFKQDVEDMGAASDLLMRLRPVRFHYLEEAVGAEESKLEQYGLIAEEVAEVAPELVAPDANGKPYSVKYHVLPALLLNELQQTERTVEAQSRLIAEQREVMTSLAARVAKLEAR